MSYDHWLYRSNPGAGLISSWSGNEFQSLGVWTDLKEKIAGACTVVRDHQPGGPPQLNIMSVTELGEYELIPDLREDRQVESIRLRGGWKEDAIYLSKVLELNAYDPQKGTDI